MMVGRVALTTLLTFAALTIPATAAVNPPPVLGSNPLFGAWGTHAVGTSTSKDFTITVTSSQWDIAPLTAVRITGAGATAFRLGGTCVVGFDLTRRSPCTSTVTFRPQAPGTFNAALVIQTGLKVYFPDVNRSAACVDLSCELRVPLRGIGVADGTGPPPPPPDSAPALQMLLSPSHAVVAAGQVTATGVRVRNAGGTALAPVAVELTLPTGSRVVNAGGGRVTATGITWSVPQVPVGWDAFRTVAYRLPGTRPRTMRVTGTATAPDAQAAGRAAVRVVAAPTPAPIIPAVAG